MKYCTKCYKLSEEGDACSSCRGVLQSCEAQSSVRVAEVKGSLRAIVEPSLKDKGIPCEFYNPEKDIFTQYNAKVNSETNFTLLVPFEFYNEAFEICVGLGVVSPEEKIQVSEDTQADSDGKTYDQRFEEATGTKRKSFTIIWIILFIVVACLLIWGVEFLAMLIKGSMGIPVTAKLLSFLN